MINRRCLNFTSEYMPNDDGLRPGPFRPIPMDNTSPGATRRTNGVDDAPTIKIFAGVSVPTEIRVVSSSISCGGVEIPTFVRVVMKSLIH